MPSACSSESACSICSTPICERASVAANSVMKRAFLARPRKASITAFFALVAPRFDCSFMRPIYSSLRGQQSYPRSSTVQHSTTPILHSHFLSLHLVSKFPGNLFGDSIIGDFLKRYFSIRKPARGLKRLDDLIHPFMGRHSVAADGFFVNRIGVFRHVAV